MKCKHVKEDGYPAIMLENGKICCSLCGAKIGLGEDEIKNLIKLSVNIDTDNIRIFFTSHDSYYYFYNTDDVCIYEDVYADGAVEERHSGKLFSDFTFVLIIKRDKRSNRVQKLVVIARSDDNESSKTSSPQIIKYLNPTIFNLLL